MAARPRVIADAGVLVALIEREEPHHAWAAGQAKRILAPMLTCESVLSEACFVLRATSGGVDALWRMIDGGGVQLAFALGAESDPVKRLMLKYRDLPMSLADACLVRMSELFPSHLVFTLDHHFRIYRRHRRRPVPLLTPATG
jgi:predicted nucleic acid-binding protein